MRHLSISSLLLFVVGLLVLGACTGQDEPSVGGADGAVAVSDSAAIADDSAPVEVASESPFLDYVTKPRSDWIHPGEASFVLVDEQGDPALVGTADFPAYGIGIHVYMGVDRPFEHTLFFSNFRLTDNGGVAATSRCGSFGGTFSQQGEGQFLFERRRLPIVEGTFLIFTDDGCGPEPAVHSEIFTGPVEIEFGDEAIVVISEDGTRWSFRQIFGRI